MDRFRKLLGKKKGSGESEARRRASHAGFEAPRFEAMRQRRQSLPAKLVKKEDEARKLHNSAACINIIEEMKSVKLIPKNLKQSTRAPLAMKHSLDPYLQKQLRARRDSNALPGITLSTIEHVSEEPEVKRATSVEGMSKIDRDLVMVGRSSSESLIAGIEVEDPEENHLSDDEPAMIQAAA